MEIIHKTNYQPVSVSADISDQIANIPAQNVRNPSISYFAHKARYGQRHFLDHEYDLYEYGRIVDTEALVARAFQKKKTLVFKQGHTIISKNPENLAYVKQRLEEISYVSKIPFRKLIREMATNLIMFHNTYTVKVRNKKASSGKVRKWRGAKEVDPIAAWFNLPPEAMQVRINEAGEGKRYRQYIDGNKYREFPSHNIIHNAYNKRTGFTMGTPPLEAVKDDILALRRIEESVETLIYKSLFPIIHVKVGNEKNPARTLPNGTSEVTAATSLLQNIEDNGGLVTSERVEVNAIGSESLALRVESYLDHFKKRVYAGLGMSGIDYGDGDTTGRATGEVLSASLADSVIDYQVELEEVITREMFDELLLETGKYEHSFQISEDDRVFLKLSSVSTEERTSRETHALNMMNSGLLTHNEAREVIERKPLSEEEQRESHEYRKQKYMDELEISKQKIIAEHATEQNIKIAKATPKPAATSGGGSSGGKVSPTLKSGGKKTTGGNTKAKKTKAQGAANTAKAKATQGKQKPARDMVSEKIIHSINYNSEEVTCLRAERLLSDYGMNKLTYGLMDASEAMDDGLQKNIRIAIADMIVDLEENELNTLKIKSIVNKTIDKIDLYINNILVGS